MNVVHRVEGEEKNEVTNNHWHGEEHREQVETPEEVVAAYLGADRVMFFEKFENFVRFELVLVQIAGAQIGQEGGRRVGGSAGLVVCKSIVQLPFKVMHILGHLVQYVLGSNGQVLADNGEHEIERFKRFEDVEN